MIGLVKLTAAGLFCLFLGGLLLVLGIQEAPRGRLSFSDVAIGAAPIMVGIVLLAMVGLSVRSKIREMRRKGFAKELAKEAAGDAVQDAVMDAVQEGARHMLS